MEYTTLLDVLKCSRNNLRGIERIISQCTHKPEFKSDVPSRSCLLHKIQYLHCLLAQELLRYRYAKKKFKKSILYVINSFLDKIIHDAMQYNHKDIATHAIATSAFINLMINKKYHKVIGMLYISSKSLDIDAGEFCLYNSLYMHSAYSCIGEIYFNHQLKLDVVLDYEAFRSLFFTFDEVRMSMLNQDSLFINISNRIKNEEVTKNIKNMLKNCRSYSNLYQAGNIIFEYIKSRYHEKPEGFESHEIINMIYLLTISSFYCQIDKDLNSKILYYLWDMSLIYHTNNKHSLQLYDNNRKTENLIKKSIEYADAFIHKKCNYNQKYGNSSVMLS
ncbi:MAG: hypothetical protein NZM04_03960 [Methylacidiphilales bacterium]|nr:hypothetical protein [Candidatus Methylacidiphilales bacterium]